MRPTKFLAFLLLPVLLVPFFGRESWRSQAFTSLPAATPSPTPKEGWLRRLVGVFGISANPGAQRSPPDSVLDAGDIWVKGLSSSSAGRRIAAGSYRSPIFLARDETILAIKGETLVRIPVSGGTEQTIPNKTGITKLIGVHEDDPNKVLVLMKKGDQTAIGFLSLSDDRVSEIEYETDSAEGKILFARLAGWDRMYCNTEVYVETQCERNASGGCKRDGNNKTKTWTDVMVKRSYLSPINVSNCQGELCGQPSLSLDGNTIVYVSREQ